VKISNSRFGYTVIWSLRDRFWHSLRDRLQWLPIGIDDSDVPPAVALMMTITERLHGLQRQSDNGFFGVSIQYRFMFF